MRTLNDYVVQVGKGDRQSDYRMVPPATMHIEKCFSAIA